MRNEPYVLFLRYSKITYCQLFLKLLVNINSCPFYFFSGNNYSGISLAIKNKTVVTCIVPLPGDISEFSQSEAGVMLKWVDSCDHMVFIHVLSRQKRHALKSIKKLKFTRNFIQNNNFSYFSGDLSEFDHNSGRFRSQYKTLEYAVIKYPDTGLFIITPTSLEIVKDVLKRFTANMENNIRTSTSINELLTTNDTLNNDIILSLDKFLILGKHAVSSLIKQVTSNNCHFDDSQSFQEWTTKCIKTLDTK